MILFVGLDSFLIHDAKSHHLRRLSSLSTLSPRRRFATDLVRVVVLIGMARSISHKICAGVVQPDRESFLGVPPASIADANKQRPNKQSSHVVSNALECRTVI
jgi:hypothetical protein